MADETKSTDYKHPRFGDQQDWRKWTRVKRRSGALGCVSARREARWRAKRIQRVYFSELTEGV